MLERLDGADYDELELVVSRVSGLLHHSHHLRLELDQRLLVRLLRLRRAARPVRDRKVQVSQNILSQLRRQHSDQLGELVRSERYLGVRLVLVETQVENMLEDYRRGVTGLKERLAGKMKESQELRILKLRLAQNKHS